MTDSQDKQASQRSHTGSGDAFEDLETHRASWRRALELSLAMAAPAGVDHDDAGYWRHELAAFDRTFDALCNAPAQPASASDCTAPNRDAVAAWILRDRG